MPAKKKTAPAATLTRTRTPSKTARRTRIRSLTTAPQFTAPSPDPTPPVRIPAAAVVTGTVPPTTSAGATSPTPASTTLPPIVIPGVVPGVVPHIAALSPLSTVANRAAPPNIASPVPNALIPAPPAGFVPDAARDFLGYRPSSRMLSAATTALANLRTFATYGQVFGSAAPDADVVLGALDLAIQWRAMRDLTATWDLYVRTQDGLAWKAALTILDQLKPLFLNASATNPALATQYAGLTSFFEAPKVAAKQGLATKAKKAKTTAAAAVTVNAASTTKSITVNT